MLTYKHTQVNDKKVTQPKIFKMIEMPISLEIFAILS